MISETIDNDSSQTAEISPKLMSQKEVLCTRHVKLLALGRNVVYTGGNIFQPLSARGPGQELIVAGQNNLV